MTALDDALSRLPGAEFVVAFHDHAEEVLAVAGDAVGVAAVIEAPFATLSGASVTAAVVTDDREQARALATMLRPTLEGAGSLEVLGPGSSAAWVADALATAVGGSRQVLMRQRLMAADEVAHPADVLGHTRPLAPSDHVLVAGWLDAFSDEALGLPPRGLAAWLGELDVALGMWVWVVDDRPVAVARGRRTTPVSARIGPVYTEPSARRRGHGAALTAVLARSLLDAGCEHVVLLTDAANPTSNRLYPRIGFVDVTAHESWVARST